MSVEPISVFSHRFCELALRCSWTAAFYFFLGLAVAFSEHYTWEYSGAGLFIWARFGLLCGPYKCIPSVPAPRSIFLSGFGPFLGLAGSGL